MTSVGQPFGRPAARPARTLLCVALLVPLLLVGLLISLPARAASTDGQWSIERMQTLVEQLPASDLKNQLGKCLATKPADELLRRHPFAIGHRGASMRYAEHSREAYVAAAAQGAGTLECDVTFTKDRQLVCRHSQCDLHRTTNILATPLANACTESFQPASGGKPASAKCCTSDITLAQFKTLRARSDSVNKEATSVTDYLVGSDRPGGGRHAEDGTVMSHDDSIKLSGQLGVAMTPELKAPQVAMPFDGDYTQQQYATDMIRAYEANNVDPARVYAQSFQLDDVRYWIEQHPAFGAQAIWLDGRYRGGNRVNPQSIESIDPSMQSLANQGVRTIAPPMWMLLSADGDRLGASAYARAANEAGLNIVAWTLERSGDLSNGGGWYYQTVRAQVEGLPDMLRALHTLQSEAKASAVFSDWPATTAIYANCFDLPR